MGEAGHRLVGDQELRLRRHGAGQFELAHLDLRQVARHLPRLGFEADLVQQRRAAVRDRLLRQMNAARRDGVEQGDADIVGKRHAGERPRQLKASRQAEMGALMGFEPVELSAVEMHGALLVVQRAADAIDQRRFAGAVRPDQAEPLAGRDRQRNLVERDEAAETLAEIVDLQKRAHAVLS